MPSIKKPKYVDDTIVNQEDNRTMEDIVKEVPLEEFLSCKATKDILVSEAYWKFERKTKYKLVKIYEEFNNAFGNDVLAACVVLTLVLVAIFIPMFPA